MREADEFTINCLYGRRHLRSFCILYKHGDSILKGKIKKILFGPLGPPGLDSQYLDRY